MTPAKRNLQLDILRGLAIIGVILHHSNFHPTGDIAAGPLGILRDQGFLGVDLFFVLSGFLVGGLLIDEHKKYGSINVARFLIRRGFKIYPAYLAFIAYLIIVPSLKLFPDMGAALDTLKLSLIKYAPNFIFLQNYIGDNPAGHTWTLAVEEHFYLTVPFLIALILPRFGAKGLIYLAMLSVTLSLCLRIMTEVGLIPSHRVMLGNTHHRIDALFVGVAVRCVYTYFPSLFLSWANARWLMISLGMICWYPWARSEDGTFGYRTYGILLQTAGALLILVGFLFVKGPTAGIPHRIFSFSAKLLAWIGLYSYGIYLWHVTATRIIERYWGQYFEVESSISSVNWISLQFVTVAGSIFVGFVTTKMVEAPFLRLREKLFPSRTTPTLAVDVSKVGG